MSSQIENSKQAPQNGSVSVIVKNNIDSNILISDTEKKIVKPSQSIISKPYISAESYLVGNLENGQIYSELNTNKVFPIASVSKLYTSLVVRHLFDPKKIITITQPMLDAYGDAGHFVLNEKFTADELLYPLLLESSNDIAEAYAQSFGYSNFIEEMNGFAKEIGMVNTSFKDSSGLSPSNVSNADDLFILAKYLYKNENNILKISDTKEFELATTSDHGEHHLININPYAFYPEFIGGKTGRTDEAKEAMVSLFQKNIGTSTYPIVIILLRSEFGEREIDTEKLLGLFMDKIVKK